MKNEKHASALDNLLESINRNQETIIDFIKRVDGGAAAATYQTLEGWKRNIQSAVSFHDKLKRDRDALLKALQRENSANLAIIRVLSEAYDRFTDNDMHPANHALKIWLSSARACIEHGSSEQTRAAIAQAETD